MSSDNESTQERVSLTPQQFTEKYGPFKEPLDLPPKVVITEVTSKNGKITFKYERTDKFAEYMEGKKQQEEYEKTFAYHMEQKEGLTEARKQEAIDYAKQEGVLPPNVEVEEVVLVRKGGKDTYEIKYKLFVPESVKPQVQAGKEFRSEYVGELKGFTYNRKTKMYTPYTTAVPLSQYDLLLAATVAVPFVSPVVGGLATKTLVGGALSSILVGEAHSYATVGKPMQYEQFVQSAFLGLATPVVTGALSDVAGAVYTKVVPSHARYVISQKVATLKSLFPAYKGSRLDVWLAKHSPKYYKTTGGIARGEVAGKLQSKYMPTLQESLAVKRAFGMSIAPRTGGVLVRQAPAITTVKQAYGFDIILTTTGLKQIFRPIRQEELVGYTPSAIRQGAQVKPLPAHWERLVTEKGFVKAHEVVIAGKKVWLPTLEHLRERGLLPFVTQTHLTRAGIIPTIDRKLFTPGMPTKLTSVQKTFIGIGGIVGVRSRAKQRQGVPVLSIMKPRLETVQEQTQVQITRQTQRLKQKQKQIQQLAITVPRAPSLKRVSITPPRLEFPKRLRLRARKPRKRGAWFYRRHPIATSKQLTNLVLGSKKKQLGVFKRAPLKMRRRSFIGGKLRMKKVKKFPKIRAKKKDFKKLLK